MATHELLNDVGRYIQQHGLLYKFGTGANAIGTEACIKQEKFIQSKFNITKEEFFMAWKIAEQIDSEEGKAEQRFFKSHPELNP